MMVSEWLFYPEVEYFSLLDKPLQVIVDLYRADTCWGAGKDEVTNLQGKETADKSNDPVNGVDHLPAVPLLYSLSIDVKPEIELL